MPVTLSTFELAKLLKANTEYLRSAFSESDVEEEA
jgi:hypothetical protein